MQRRLRRIGVVAALIVLGVLLVGSATSADSSTSRAAEHLAPAVSEPRAAASASTPLLVQVSSKTVGAAMPSGFIGLSVEYPAIVDYLGSNPRALDPVFLALVRGINPGGPPVLRIGGNSTDHTWWPAKHIHPSPGITFSLTKGWLAVVHAMASALQAHMILGVNLAAGSRRLAAVEARALVSGIGRRYVEALEIGNEPDVYHSFPWYLSSTGKPVTARPRRYDLADYLAEFHRWQAVMPRVPLAGPALAATGWMSDLPSLLAHEQGLSVFTFHRYPLRNCVYDPTAALYASIPNLLSDTSSSGLAQSVALYVALVHDAGLPFRLDELNSASCEGRPGVSNTFASALWALDSLFSLASVGVDGVNIHTLPGAAYEPFTFTEKHGHWTGSVRPLYYGLLMFAQAFPRGARLLAVDAPAGPVKAWATQAPDGHTRVVLINKDPDVSATVRIELTGTQPAAQVERLTAPSVRATSGVTLGDEGFGASTRTGVLPANPHPATVTPAGGYYTVAVPAGSAVMLTR